MKGTIPKRRIITRGLMERHQIKKKDKVMKKFLLILFIVFGLMISVASCNSPADTASTNLSTQADQFQINRRIVFYNGITNDYILVIEGYCSLGNYDPAGSLSVTCKVGDNQYKKHFLGLSDNVTYFAEQIDASSVSPYYYKVIFRPSTIVPDISVQTP